MARAHPAATVAGLLLALAACSGEPVEVADVVIEVHRPDEPLVLDPVLAPFEVRRVSLAPASQTSVGYEPLINSATVYAVSGSDPPLDGATLLVGTSAGSAMIGGPDPTVPGAHPVDLDLGYGGATFGPAGDRSWVVLPVGPSDWIGYVVGRGVSKGDLVAAARGADFLGTPPTIATASLPHGFVPVVAGSPGDGPVSWQGQQIELVADDILVRVSVVRADPRLATLWGFWAVGDGAGSREGRAGPMPGTIIGRGAYGEVWAENGNVVGVIGADYGALARGPEAARTVVEQVVAALRTGTTEELGRLEDLVLAPPTAEQISCPAGSEVLTGRRGAVRWAYAATSRPGGQGFTQCSATANPVDGLNGDVREDPRPLPPVGVVMLGTVHAAWGYDRPQHDGVVVGGIAPPGTTRVVVQAPNGQTMDAVLSNDGPRPGERVFATFFAISQPESGITGPFPVTALDVAGQVLDTANIS